MISCGSTAKFSLHFARQVGLIFDPSKNVVTNSYHSSGKVTDTLLSQLLLGKQAGNRMS